MSDWTKPALPPLTEALVQDLVYAWCYACKHEITVPNTGAPWGAEADVASLTKALMGHAFEIKVSRADWLAELRHIRGFCHCHDGRHDCAKHARAKMLAKREAKRRAAEVKRLHDKGSNCCGLVPPSYFWLVTAPGIVKPEELPLFAGLLEVVPYRYGKVEAHGYMLAERESAPRLHTVKQLPRQVMAMARGATLRYWEQRRKHG